MSELHKKFCTRPWDYIEVSHTDPKTLDCYNCCPLWTNSYSFGRITENNKDIDSVWNGDVAKEFRKSILDGSYKYCDKNVCPYIVGNTLPTKEDVLSGKYGEYYKDVIEKNLIESQPPEYITLSYDVSCNLSCPSCRKQFKFLNEKNNSSEYKFKQSFQDQLIDYLYQCKTPVRVTITGSGDPFASKLFWEFLQKLDGNLNKNISITLQTNGLLFNKENWEKLYKMHNNEIRTIISLDAGSEETYNYVRRGGNWNTLMSNLKFVSELYEQKKLQHVRLDCVVQSKNYRELDKFVNIAKKYNFDCFFQKILKLSDTYTDEEFKYHNIFDKDHPEHSDFVELINQDFNCEKLQFGNLSEFRK